jgi:hypothetical protein
VIHKKTMAGAALLVVAAFSSHAGTENTRTAKQALHCSAIFTVFTEALTDDPALSKQFAQGVELFTALYVKERGADAGAMRQEAVTQRAALLQQFRDQLGEREAYLREDGVVCGAWAEGFFAQGEDYTFVPVYPKVIGMGARQKYTKIAADAFTRWKK